MLLMWILGHIFLEILEGLSQIQEKKIIDLKYVASVAVWTYLRNVTRLLGEKVRSASVCGCPHSS